MTPIGKGGELSRESVPRMQKYGGHGCSRWAKLGHGNEAKEEVVSQKARPVK